MWSAIVTMEMSIVIPAYNEEKNIERVVSGAVKTLNALYHNYEVLIVDDCSKDKTGEIIENLSRQDPHIRYIHHPLNLGTGMALKTCYTNAQGDLIVFIPGDGQVPADQIHKLLPHITAADIVVGHRIKRADPIYRKINASLYSMLIRLLFGLKIKDIDSVKLFRRTVFEKISIDSTSSFIEAEILIKAHRNNLRIVEFPINHYPRIGGRQTGASLKVIINALWEVVKFRIKANERH